MLNGKQRNYLRKLAHDIDTIFQVGKNGIIENTIIQFDEALEAREIVKANVLKNAFMDPKEAALEIAKKTDAQVVTVIGHKFVLYRESKENKEIVLPN